VCSFTRCSPRLIPTVEIAGGEQTSRETVKATREFMERMGKSPVVLNREVPGYIVNRLQAALLREAIDLVDKGIASPEEVDKAFCNGTGLRDPLIGPFLRMHLAGNGIEGFIEHFGQSYRYRWETMETWTSIPSSALKAVVDGTKEMEIVRRKSLGEIRTWRDEMLVKLLELMG
jgi:carnitine 3-dehydrogenase